jgi:hypothetical protein
MRPKIDPSNAGAPPTSRRGKALNALDASRTDAGRKPDRPARLLLKLALRACERGDAEAAAEALRGVLAFPESDRAATPASRRAVSLAKFAAMVGYSTRHIRTLISRGVIPSDAILRTGRAQRILVERAIDALRVAERDAPDSLQAEGAAFVRRRSRLRVVPGGAGNDSPGE